MGKNTIVFISDPKNKVVLDILPKRYSTYLTSYFRSIPLKDRMKIKYFVSDMWKTYKEMSEIFFKNLTFIVDKYYWTRQGIWDFESIRKVE